MTLPKNQEKTTKTLLIIGILLNIIVFSSFPESHSKYWDENNSALAYNTRLYNISAKELNLALTSANYKMMNLSFSLTKSEFAKETEKDTYTVTIPNGCTSNNLKNGVVDGQKIKYEINDLENTRNINLSCPVSALITSDKVKVEVTIHEKVEQEAAFLYQKKTLEWTLDDYYQKYPKPTNDISQTKTAEFYLDATNKYKDFETWIKKYVATISPEYTSKYTSIVLEYINQVYKTDADIINDKLSLPGIKMTKDSDKVTITLNDNLIGYARTADNSTKRKGYIYVSATDDDMTNKEQNLETAFEAYLDSYSRSSADKQVIIDYVKSFDPNGISYVILPKNNNYNTIPGITYYPKEVQPYGEEKLLILDPNLIDYAYAKVKKQIRIETGKSITTVLPDGTETTIYIDEMMQYSFKEVLTTVYGNIISENTLLEIKNNKDITSAVSQNNKVSKTFNDYFLVYDETNGYNLLIKIYAKETEPYTFVTVEKVENNENIEITFVDKKPTTEITTTGLTKAEIETIINQMSLPNTTTITISDIAGEDPTKIKQNIKITNGKIEEILAILTKLNEAIENKNSNITDEDPEIEESVTPEMTEKPSETTESETVIKKEDSIKLPTEEKINSTDIEPTKETINETEKVILKPDKEEKEKIVLKPDNIETETKTDGSVDEELIKEEEK